VGVPGVLVPVARPEILGERLDVYVAVPGVLVAVIWGLVLVERRLDADGDPDIEEDELGLPLLLGLSDCM